MRPRGMRGFSVAAIEILRTSDRDSYERRFEQIIGNSPALETVLEQVERGRAYRFYRADPGRNRHRQRAHRARDPQHQLTVRTPFRKVELRCHSLGSAGE